MNIFYLDVDQEVCVKYMVDKHVVKMPLETTQILSSVYYFTDQPYLAPYALTHANHPCCIWARESLDNWLWLRRLGILQCREFLYRYEHIHACESLISHMLEPALEHRGLTPFCCAMPEYCKISNDPVQNYRYYYNHEKQKLFSWKKRPVPDWIINF